MKLSKEKFPPEITEYFPDLDQREEINRKTYERLKAEGKFTYDDSTTFSWVIQESGLPWMPLDLEYPWQEMLKEAEAVKDEFISHRTGGERGYYDGNKNWSAAVLHGISKTHTETFGAYGYKSDKETPYQWTEVADLCPITTKFFKEVYPCKEYYRLRYIKLASGGFIYPHTDFKGQNNMLWFINLALNNPSDFHFRMEGLGYVPFAPGKAMMLNTSHEHGLVNLDEEDRIHMIVHGMPLREPQFQELVLRSYKKVCDNPELFWKIK